MGHRSEAAKRMRSKGGESIPPGPAGTPVSPGNPKGMKKSVVESDDKRIREARLAEYENLPKRRAPHDDTDDSALLRGLQRRARGEE